MENPFRTRYRVRKYFAGPFHYVEYKKWWQREWNMRNFAFTRDGAVAIYRKLTGHDPD